MHWTIIYQVFMTVIIVKAWQAQKMYSEGCSVRKSYKRTKKQGKKLTLKQRPTTKRSSKRSRSEEKQTENFSTELKGIWTTCGADAVETTCWSGRNQGWNRKGALGIVTAVMLPLPVATFVYGTCQEGRNHGLFVLHFCPKRSAVLKFIFSACGVARENKYCPCFLYLLTSNDCGIYM